MKRLPVATELQNGTQKVISKTCLFKDYSVIQYPTDEYTDWTNTAGKNLSGREPNSRLREQVKVIDVGKKRANCFLWFPSVCISLWLLILCGFSYSTDGIRKNL